MADRRSRMAREEALRWIRIDPQFAEGLGRRDSGGLGSFWWVFVELLKSGAPSPAEPMAKAA